MRITRFMSSKNLKCLPSLVYWPDGFTFAHGVLGFGYLIAVCLLLFFSARAWKNALKRKPNLERREYIEKLFEKAIKNKEPLEGHFRVQEGKHFWDVRATLVKVSGNAIYLKTNIVYSEPISSREVMYPKEAITGIFTARFSYNEKELVELKSKFISQASRQGIVYIKLAFPEKLTKTSKRKSIRTKIEDDVLVKAMLWVNIDIDNLPESPNQLKRNFLTHRSNEKEEFRCVDISPNGFGFKFDKKLLLEKNIGFEKKVACLLLLSLVHLDTEEAVKLCLVLEFRHAKYGNKDVHAGYYIIRHADIPQAGQNVKWEINDREDGVEAIHRWISRTK